MPPPKKKKSGKRCRANVVRPNLVSWKVSQMFIVRVMVSNVADKNHLGLVTKNQELSGVRNCKRILPAKNAPPSPPAPPSAAPSQGSYAVSMHKTSSAPAGTHGGA